MPGNAIARLRQAVKLYGGVQAGGPKPPDWEVLVTEALLELADRGPAAGDPNVAAALAIKCARLEQELERVTTDRDQAVRQCQAWVNRMTEPEELARTLQIIGIPAKDLAAIFQMEADWRRSGGSQRLLELLTELHELRLYKERKELAGT